MNKVESVTLSEEMSIRMMAVGGELECNKVCRLQKRPYAFDITAVK
jgi:hypothetical protein